MFPLLVRPCAWQAVEWVKRMQLLPQDGKPLSGGSDYEIDSNLASVVLEISRLLSAPGSPTP